MEPGGRGIPGGIREPFGSLIFGKRNKFRAACIGRKSLFIPPWPRTGRSSANHVRYFGLHPRNGPQTWNSVNTRKESTRSAISPGEIFCSRSVLNASTVNEAMALPYMVASR